LNGTKEAKRGRKRGKKAGSRGPETIKRESPMGRRPQGVRTRLQKKTEWDYAKRG